MRALLRLLIVAISLLPLSLHAVTVSISALKLPTCTHADGSLQANVNGGVGPYTYAWSTGGSAQIIGGLLPGTYSVTVTDYNMEQATANITMNAGDYGQINTYVGDFFNYGNGLCNSTTVVGFEPSAITLVGPPPYFINGAQLDTMWLDFMEGGPLTPVLGTPIYNPVSGYQSLTFADGDGCPGTYVVDIGWPVEWPTLSTLSIQGACEGTSSGSITISSTGEGHEQFVQTMIEPNVPDYPYHITGGGPSTFTITGLTAGSYTLTQFMSITYMLPSSGCSTTFSFTIPSLGPDCGVVSGNVFVDNDQNCVQNGSEPYVPGTILEIQPGPHYLVTDAQGHYEQVLPLGSYTVEQQSATFQEHCTGTPIPFTLSSGTLMVTQNLPDTSLVVMDAKVAIGSGTARPGFPLDYALHVTNLTPTSTGAGTVTMVIDPMLGYLSASPTPSNVNGNTLTWNLASMGAWQQRHFTINTMVPPDINLLGTQLTSTTALSTANTDGDLTNNTATNLRTISGAYDPNDKLAYTSSGGTEVWQIDADEWIDYTIRFQNTGTDTAFNVVITDTLPLNLDPGSINMGAGSHTFTWELRDAGTLTFYFPNILLPDSNVNEAASHGFASFRIKPRQPVLSGTTIENIANIYFDFNPPVITEPSLLNAEFSTGMHALNENGANVYPNPATDRVHIACAECGSAPYDVTILATDGRTVLQTRFLSEAEGINISSLANGSYLLRAIGTNGSSITPFIKESHR